MNFEHDVYFLNEYGNLSAILEKGTSETFEFENEYGKIRHMFIKREIGEKVDGETWYDLITPYGYGGPLIVKYNGKEEYLIESFFEAFKKYCGKNNIVSEFIRFHPLAGNGKQFSKIYHSEHDRNTLGTNLAEFDDPVQSEFSKECRKNIRQALRKGVKYRIDVAPNRIDKFLEIYNETMERNCASGFYYFPKEYFDSLVHKFRNHLLYAEATYNGTVISARLCLIAEGIIHIHLSGTLNEYLSLSPEYVLHYGLTVWGKENGYKLIHNGGGRTNSVQDTLYRFKKQFAKNTEFPFYIGKKIWNEDVYKLLCMKRKVDSKMTIFFPAYRG